MVHRNLNVAQCEKQIRRRLIATLTRHSPAWAGLKQPNLFSRPLPDNRDDRFQIPSYSMTEFLNYVDQALPAGNLYLFGGILRDLAMFGPKGFASDIDLVVDGDWAHVKSYLKELGASVNRFGGYRLLIDGWPIDLWAAQDTWAVRHGLVKYSGIFSLTETTILNWDAILMNWGTKRVLCNRDYFLQIHNRSMDIVLAENPNPLRAAVRVFRHLCMNDAKTISLKAAKYLYDAAQRYSTETILNAETASYNDRVITPILIRFFREIDTSSDESIERSFERFPIEKQVDGQSNAYQPHLI